MPPVYLVEQGAQVSLEQNRLLIERAGGILLKVPLAHCSALVLFGNISLTTPTIKRLLQEAVDVVFLSVHGE